MLKKMILLFFVFNSLSNALCADWTWFYQMRCNEATRLIHGKKKMIFFERDTTPHFTQLVFSWNVIRPVSGHFSFYVQVRDAENRKWGTWHHMADWGSGIQKTYVSKSDSVSSFVHVRLEMETKKVADAFRIKIIPYKNASLSLVHGCAVTLSDFNVFKAEQIVSDQLSSLYIQNVPMIAQLAIEHADNSRICSPTSCTMLVQYLTGVYKDPIEFAEKSFDTGLSVYGSWPCNIAHAFEHCNGAIYFAVKRMNSFTDLHRQLIKGIPVVVSVRGNLPGALKPFPHGHLLVVVGWDNKTREVLCHDPAAETNEKVFKRYPIADFLRAWECSHRLSYVADLINSVGIQQNK